MSNFNDLHNALLVLVYDGGTLMRPLEGSVYKILTKKGVGIVQRYIVLDMIQNGLLEEHKERQQMTYKLTQKGLATGKTLLEELKMDNGPIKTKAEKKRLRNAG